MHDLELSQVGHVTYLRGQRGHLVVAKVEDVEVGVVEMNRRSRSSLCGQMTGTSRGLEYKDKILQEI